MGCNATMSETIRPKPLLRAAGALVPMLLLFSCDPTELTELECVQITATDAAGGTTERTVCTERRFRLIVMDEFYDPEVVRNETW